MSAWLCIVTALIAPDAMSKSIRLGLRWKTNPVGAWRDTYHNGREVDTSGELFRRHEFKTIEQFKDALLAEKPRFVKGFRRASAVVCAWPGTGCCRFAGAGSHRG